MLYLKRLGLTDRQLIPTAAERVAWSRGAGDGLQVPDTELGKIGGLICWENYMPAARLAMYQQGVECVSPLQYMAMKTNGFRIYIAPNADDLPAWVASMQHIAKEGRCFVISVNQFCKVKDFPEDYPPFAPESHDRQEDGAKWEPESILSHGGTCVVGPLGTFIAGPVWDKEEIVYAELNRDDLIESRVCTLSGRNFPGANRPRWTLTLWDRTLDRIYCKLSDSRFMDRELTRRSELKVNTKPATSVSFS